MVESVIPNEGEFTVADLMRSLEAIDPGRVWPKTSVLRHVTKLRKLKLVRRVKRHQVGQSAVYVRSNGEDEHDPTLRDIIQSIVTKPMRTAEVVHAVGETGWKTTVTRECFRAYIKATLRKCGFREREGKWVV